jgi:hypothetical protein
MQSTNRRMTDPTLKKAQFKVQAAFQGGLGLLPKLRDAPPNWWSCVWMPKPRNTAQRQRQTPLGFPSTCGKECKMMSRRMVRAKLCSSAARNITDNALRS